MDHRRPRRHLRRPDQRPASRLILPDRAFIVEQHAPTSLGIVLTHAHEDHIGAVAWLWPRLRRRSTRRRSPPSVLREKLREPGLLDEAQLTEVPLSGSRSRLGPFDLELVTLTHSIPEPNGLAIRTPLGTVLHTGDWKIDPDPLLGEPTDAAHTRPIGDEGVLAMVCDSTNVFVDGEAGSEADVRARSSTKVVRTRKRVAVTCFASNVARVEHRACRRGPRAAGLPGRPLDAPHGRGGAGPSACCGRTATFIDEDEAGLAAARERALPLHRQPGRAARRAVAHRRGRPSPRLARAGDTVIFSSRVIPGNEIAIRAAEQARRARRRADHRPGPRHPRLRPSRARRAEADVHWARPRIAVPIHGERRHLLEHAKLALELQVPEAIAPSNGDLIRLAPGPAKVIDEVPAGRLSRDGDVLVPDERRRCASAARSYSTALTASLVLDGRSRPMLDARVGLPASTIRTET